MTREIRTTFAIDGATYEVMADVDKLNGLHSCKAPCAFNDFGDCRGRLSQTGDCKSRWREDHASVYFRRLGKELP